ncbi:MAG: flagellar biosynthetic protein FliO [Planctomycetaceae bacterium]
MPLLREAVPAPRPADAPRPAAPAGLGDWRLVAALGATFAVLVGARIAATRRVSPPPPDVFEVLGTASLGGQHTVRIVRFGPKTLLVGVSAAGATTLAEIGDPQATACIAAACRGIREPARPRGRPAPSPAARPVSGEAA